MLNNAFVNRQIKSLVNGKKEDYLTGCNFCHSLILNLTLILFLVLLKIALALTMNLMGSVRVAEAGPIDHICRINCNFILIYNQKLELINTFKLFIIIMLNLDPPLIDNEPVALYVTSGYNFFGGYSPVNYILKFIK